MTVRAERPAAHLQRLLRHRGGRVQRGRPSTTGWSIEAEAEVDDEPVAARPRRRAWERRPERATTPTRGGEFLLPTGDEPPAGNSAASSTSSTAASPRALLDAVKPTVIPERFEYRQGATFVGSTVDDLLDGGAGVCQDFAHLALILLRREGIAARYVSGLPVRHQRRRGRRLGRGQHPRLGRGAAAGPRRRRAGLGRRRPDQPRARRRAHVKIGHGRHYGDVPPIRGVYRGSAPGAEHDVKVRMTWLEGSG